MRFWDASAVVPLLVQEAFTDDMLLLLKGDALMMVWWATRVECISALSRRAREGVIDPVGEVKARNLLTVLVDRWTEVEPTDSVRTRAEHQLSIHALRAADALQLAAALTWSDGRPENHTFVCLDQQLHAAARREGFTLLPG